jgi:hypothetical protein
LADRDQVSRSLALQQFRYGGVSAKGIAFLCAAMAGRRGIKTWNAVAEFQRKHLRTGQAKLANKHGHQGYFQSLIEKN